MKHINAAKFIVGVILLAALGTLLPFKFAGPVAIAVALFVIFAGLIAVILIGNREVISEGEIIKSNNQWDELSTGNFQRCWPTVPGAGKASDPRHLDLIHKLNDAIGSEGLTPRLPTESCVQVPVHGSSH